MSIWRGLWTSVLGLGLAVGLATDARAAAEPEKSPNQPASLQERLRAGEDAVRFQAAQELAAQGPAAAGAVDALLQALDDPQPLVRAAAAEALGAIGPAAKKAVPRLLERLKEDKDGPLCVVAGEAVARIAGAELAPQLITLLGDSEPAIQAAAANGLHALGAEARGAMPTVLTILAQNDPKNRKAAIWVVMGLGPEAQAAVPGLLPILDSDDFHSQYWAQRALAAIGPAAKPAVPKLIALLSTGVVSVRRHSAIALGAIGPGIGPEGLQALERALNDPLEPVREDAVIALGKLGDFAQPAAPAVQRVLEHRKIAALVPASRTLWGLTRDTAHTVPALVEALEDPNTAEAAAQLLGEIGPPAQAALPALSRAASSDEPGLHDAAQEALRRIQADPKERK